MKTAAFSAAELRFWGWIPRAPDLSDFYAKGRGGLQPGASRDSVPPLGAAPKPAAPLGVSHGEAGKPTALPGLLHGEAGKSTTLPGLLHGEARKPTMPLGLLHGEARKPTAPPGLLRGEARKPTTTVAFARARFFGRAAGRNGALPYNARKSQFLRNGDVWATESLF